MALTEKEQILIVYRRELGAAQRRVLEMETEINRLEKELGLMVTVMSQERISRLEAMINQMSEKMGDCVGLIRPMYDLVQQIEICGASVELTKAVTMAGDIMHKLIDATGVKYLPPEK